MQILNYLTLSVMQLILFTFIPLITYVFSQRKIKGFLSYIGLMAPKINNWKNIIVSFALSYALLFIGLFIMNGGGAYKDEISKDISPAVFIISLLLHSFIRTGLSEEILFRGFIAKLLIPKIGFFYGNLVQAVLFGMPHFLFLNGVSVYIRIFHVIRSTIVGFIFCYVNEKEADGSIVPSWIFHGIANTVSTLIILII